MDDTTATAIMQRFGKAYFKKNRALLANVLCEDAEWHFAFGADAPDGRVRTGVDGFLRGIEENDALFEQLRFGDVKCFGCAVGSWGGRRPSPGGYVAGTGATDGGPPPEGANVAATADPARRPSDEPGHSIAVMSASLMTGPIALSAGCPGTSWSSESPSGGHPR
jgi:hypothetical protein